MLPEIGQVQSDTDKLERKAILRDIKGLWDSLTKHGLDVRRLKATARTMIIGKRSVPEQTLVEARGEIAAVLREQKTRETESRMKIHGMRAVFAAGILALISVGAIIEKRFEPMENLGLAVSQLPEKIARIREEIRERTSEPTDQSAQRSTQRERRPDSDNRRHTSSGPDFLHEDNVKLRGLSFLVANNDTFDRYIFNGVTGNRMFAKTYEIQGGLSLNFPGRRFEMPYGAFLFKAFDPKSNVHLPIRLGKAKKGATLADLFNSVTRYRAHNEKEIKTILSTSYELSFGIHLPHEYIQIISNADGSIETILYIGPNPELLVGETTIARKTAPDPNDPERQNITDTEDKTWRLVDAKGNLLFPPSATVEQGIAIPYNALPEVNHITYAKTFQSQGKTIRVDINISIDSVLEEQRNNMDKEESQKLFIDGTKRLLTQEQVHSMERRGEHGLIYVMNNLSWFVPQNDHLVTQLAHQITDSFHPPREKMQAILDFLSTLNYVPDSYGDTPRTPRVSLISHGGDCEDSSILGLSLARAVGIDCVFLYVPRHALLACDVDGPGTSIHLGSGEKYEWAETTGGVTEEDELGNRKKRAWRVGEKPPETQVIEWAQQVGKLPVRVNNR